MLNKNIVALLAFGLIMLVASCAKEGPTGPTGPAGPSFTGTINGHVSLYDQYGSPVLINLYKAVLTLSGDTAIHPDANGLYSLTTTLTGYITTGNYSITASDSAYGATQINTFEFVQGTLTKDIKMSALPTFLIDTLIANNDSAAAYDSLLISVPADTRPRNCIVFVNSVPAVANLPANYLLSYVKAIPANSTSVTLLIPAQDLYNAGLAHGNVVYYAVYSYVINDVSVYEDLGSGKKVYNSVANPKVDSTIVP